MWPFKRERIFVSWGTGWTVATVRTSPLGTRYVKICGRILPFDAAGCLDGGRRWLPY